MSRKAGMADYWLTDHPIAIGRSVTIVGVNQSPYIEGRAKVVAIEKLPHTYRVIFEHEIYTRVRVVHPAFQRNPKQSIDALRELMKTGRDASPSISDFYPDDNVGSYADGNRARKGRSSRTGDAVAKVLAGDHGD